MAAPVRPATGDRLPWITAALAALIYLPAVASVGLRTDVAAHLRFAEIMASTGQEYGPYFLFQQLVILVRVLVPFGALGELFPTLAEPATIWDVSAMVVLLGAVALLAFVICGRFRGAFAGVLERRRDADLLAAAVTLVCLVVAPITVFTWGRQQLLVGYVSITSYENPTVMLARPLGLILFWFLMDRLRGRHDGRTVATAAALTLVALHAKPSYVLCLAPAMATYLLWCRWRGREVDQRLVLLGLLVPAAVGLAFQLAAGSDQGGVAVAPFRIISDLLGARGLSPWLFAPLLVLSALLPLVVAATYGRVERPSSWSLSWLTFVVGLVIYCTFTVTGRRDYGDFVWGAQISLFVLFVESLLLALPRMVRRWDWRGWLVLGTLGLHLASGAMLYYREIVDPAAWW